MATFTTFAFREGGDRLAKYCIAQYESALKGTYANTASLLNCAVHTRTDTGHEYLSKELLGAMPGSVRHRNALSAIRYSANPKDAKLAAAVVEADLSVDDREIGVLSLFYILSRSNTFDKPSRDLLMALEGDSSESDVLRKRAFFALNEWELRETTPSRQRPTDLEAERLSKVQDPCETLEWQVSKYSDPEEARRRYDPEGKCR